MRFKDLPILKTWPPDDPRRIRLVGAAQGPNGRWYVIFCDPPEIIGPAGSFESIDGVTHWIGANCERMR